MAKDKKERLPARVCPGCGTRFTPDTRNQVYCTTECRKQYYQKKYYGQQVYDKVCPGCGTDFQTTNSQQVYCCPDCRQDAQTGKCMICGQGGKVYAYRDLRLCVKCYYMAKGVDSGLAEKYKQLVGGE